LGEEYIGQTKQFPRVGRGRIPEKSREFMRKYFIFPLRTTGYGQRGALLAYSALATTLLPTTFVDACCCRRRFIQVSRFIVVALIQFSYRAVPGMCLALMGDRLERGLDHQGVPSRGAAAVRSLGGPSGPGERSTLEAVSPMKPVDRSLDLYPRRTPRAVWHRLRTRLLLCRCPCVHLNPST